MSEGYKPQASDISKTLILTFVLGVVVGTVIGWGARSTVMGKPDDAPALSVAEQTPAPEAPAAELPAPETPAPDLPAPEAASVTATEPGVAQVAFDADVDGLWPAAHLWVGIEGTKADLETQEWLNEFKPGGVVLGPENVTDPLQLGALVLQIKQAVGLGTTIADAPFIVYQDSENALPRILAGDSGTAPVNDPGAAAASAAEALKQGVGVFLGPSLDIYTPGVSEARLERASLGGSAEAVSGPALDYARRLMDAGVVPVARLFPGAGLAKADGDGVWRILANQMNELAVAMQPFKAAIDAEIPGILVGLMAVPGIDTERPNRPAALSPRLLQLLVRQDWAYTGVLIADDITRNPMTRELPRDEIALKALFSGCDVVVLRDANRADLLSICTTFTNLAKRDDFPAEQIAGSKGRLDAWLDRLGKPVAAQAPVIAEAEIPAAPPLTEATPAEVATSPAAAEPAVETPVPEVAAAPEVPATETAEPVEPPVAAETLVVEHTIVKGDSLTALARRYNVSISDIRAWNGMESDVVKIGQVLKLQASATAGGPPTGEATPDTAAAETPTTTSEAAPESVAETVPEIIAPETPPVAETPPAGAPVPENAAVETPVPAVDPVPELPASEPTATTTEPAVEPDVAAPEVPENTSETAVAGQPPNTDRREHIVAAGETLSLVAGTYGISVADIQAWNGLDPEETVINAGAALVLYLPVAAPPAGTSESSTSEGAPPVFVEPAAGTYDTHTVAPGDNLRRIAQRYGTTQQVLMSMNNMTDPNLVKLGAKIKVPKQPEGSAPPAAVGGTP